MFVDIYVYTPLLVSLSLSLSLSLRLCLLPSFVLLGLIRSFSKQRAISQAPSVKENLLMFRQSG
jgi:hypothetical protein